MYLVPHVLITLKTERLTDWYLRWKQRNIAQECQKFLLNFLQMSLLVFHT